MGFQGLVHVSQLSALGISWKKDYACLESPDIRGTLVKCMISCITAQATKPIREESTRLRAKQEPQ